MKFLFKKIYITFFLLFILLINNTSLAKDKKNQYVRVDATNYFLGIISANQEFNHDAFKYLKEVQTLKQKHPKFNTEYTRTLVLLGKIKESFTFSKSIWKEEELLFETDILLGLQSFIKKDYANAEKYFKRLNKISRQNLIFDDFVGNVLIAWVKASQGNKEESFKFIKKIPYPYRHIKNTQNIFLQCYFDSTETQKSFEKIIEEKDYNFSRYSFFLVNYLLSTNKVKEANIAIKQYRERYSSNLLIKQTENFLLKKKINKITKFFDCKNPKDSIAEFFYVIANLYASEQDFKLSNFYLKISLFLNENFTSNKALLAENLFLQKKYKKSKNIYYDLKKIGPIYSWFASKNISLILLNEKGKTYSVKALEKDFKKIENPDFENYYELANFYKDNDLYEKAIKYYSLVLSKIKKNHKLVAKIFYRRGISYERLGNWESAEKDLLESLKILPNQAHVLNYLAYTWVDKRINLDKSLLMLKKATEMRKNDGYIIDSLGWAYYAKKNYSKAEFFLQKAVELMPSEPIINDHYADSLWMQNKNIQARYIWNYVLKLDSTEKKLKNIIRKKIVFGITG